MNATGEKKKTKAIDSELNPVWNEVSIIFTLQSILSLAVSGNVEKGLERKVLCGLGNEAKILSAVFTVC